MNSTTYCNRCDDRFGGCVYCSESATFDPTPETVTDEGITCIVCGAGVKGGHTTCWHCRRDAGMDTDTSMAAVENATDDIAVGGEYLHFRPSTGRIICVVRAVEVKGDAVIVERVNGPRKGERYPVGSDVLEPA